jgi:hypothetical protein
VSKKKRGADGRRRRDEVTYDDIQHGSELGEDEDFMSLIEQSIQ